MDLTNIRVIKNLCRQYQIRPSKKLGQSFLIKRSFLNKIIVQGNLKKSDLVLEIGPGFGALTFELVKRVKQVIAVEKDKRLVEFLKTRIQEYKNIEIINGDVLKLDVSKILLNGRGILRSAQDKVVEYKIISNLPYQITSPVLWKFLHEEKHKPELMVLMVQKEVAERIVAKPREMSILSVMCQFYAECKIVSKVKRTNFWPQPEVDSAIIKIKPRNYADRPFDSLSTRFARSRSLRAGAELHGKKMDEWNFFKVVKIGFAHKRKMLKNNLTKGLKISGDKVTKVLQEIGLNEKVRAQELGVEEWVELNQWLLVRVNPRCNLRNSVTKTV